MDEKIRINKYLSEAGICSRREADRMIEEGRITVNGKKQKAVRKSAWKMRSVQTIYLSIKMKKKYCFFLTNPEESCAAQSSSLMRRR